MTEIGTPLPADLAEIDAKATLNQHTPEEMKRHLAYLHGVHHNYNAEQDAIRAKQIEVKRVTTKIYANRDMATLAGFDNVLKLGPSRWTVEKAHAYLKDAADGFINLPTTLFERLKRIVLSGKDEE